VNQYKKSFDKAFSKQKVYTELSPTNRARLKFILWNKKVLRRINDRRDKIRGNHYMESFRVKASTGSKDDINDYMGVIELPRIIVPKEFVGEYVQINISKYAPKKLPENPIFLRESKVLERMKQ